MSADLERDLRRLDDSLDWPETPDLVRRVSSALASAEPVAGSVVSEEVTSGSRGASRGRAAASGPALPRRRRSLLTVLAIGVLAPAAGAVAFPGARDDVLEWLQIKSVEVRRAPQLPPGARDATPNELGVPVSLAQAKRRAGFEPVLPPRLGDPREARLRDGVVTVVYHRGIRLAQLRGALDENLLRKIVTTNEVRAVPEGIFVQGRHVYLYLRPDGTVTEARTTGTTLIAQRGDLLLRLEGIRTYEEGRGLLGGG